MRTFRIYFTDRLDATERTITARTSEDAVRDYTRQYGPGSVSVRETNARPFAELRGGRTGFPQDW